ncbi:hypothetical protein DMJ13_02270 [halophilic archaeon]|nr:hypothetical protein DMJ13_02270 [halophilic archaeon]
MYVTHDRTTARTLADRIAVIDDGDIVQVGPPDAVFERPANLVVVRFTGANCLEREDGRLPGTPVAAGDSLAVGDEVGVAFRDGRTHAIRYLMELSR